MKDKKMTPHGNGKKFRTFFKSAMASEDIVMETPEVMRALLELYEKYGMDAAAIPLDGPIFATGMEGTNCIGDNITYATILDPNLRIPVIVEQMWQQQPGTVIRKVCSFMENIRYDKYPYPLAIILDGETTVGARAYLDSEKNRLDPKIKRWLIGVYTMDEFRAALNNGSFNRDVMRIVSAL